MQKNRRKKKRICGCDEKYLNAIIASSRARTKCAIAKLSVRENERELRKGEKNSGLQQQKLKQSVMAKEMQHTT